MTTDKCKVILDSAIRYHIYDHRDIHQAEVVYVIEDYDNNGKVYTPRILMENYDGSNCYLYQGEQTSEPNAENALNVWKQAQEAGIE